MANENGVIFVADSSGHRVVSETPQLSTYYIYGKVCANSVRFIRYKFHKFSSMIFKLETSCRLFHNQRSTEEMIRAKKPCRQLNSEAIKSAAICYLTPVISGRCSVISAKCVCNVKETALPKAWNAICRKRDSCDRAISGL